MDNNRILVNGKMEIVGTPISPNYTITGQFQVERAELGWAILQAAAVMIGVDDDAGLGWYTEQTGRFVYIGSLEWTVSADSNMVKLVDAANVLIYGSPFHLDETEREDVENGGTVARVIEAIGLYSEFVADFWIEESGEYVRVWPNGWSFPLGKRRPEHLSHAARASRNNELLKGIARGDFEK